MASCAWSTFASNAGARSPQRERFWARCGEERAYEGRDGELRDLRCAALLVLVGTRPIVSHAKMQLAKSRWPCGVAKRRNFRV